MSKILTLHGVERGTAKLAAPALGEPSDERKDLRSPIEGIDSHGAVTVIRLASAPGVLWSSHGAAAFRSTLNAVAATSGVTAIVLHGDGVFEDPGAENAEAAAGIIASVTSCPVPVFAALEGDAIGAGLELALACTGRVAKEGSRFALPAVMRGDLPVLGGVQRLMALTEVDTAARLIVFGETIHAAAALSAGLIDGMVARGVARLAVALARSHDHGPAGPPPRPHSIFSDLPSIRYQIGARARGQAAPLAAVQAMEAAMRLPPRRSAVEVREIAGRLAATEQARALRHAAECESALTRIRYTPGLAVRLAWPMRREAIHLADEGALPAQIDRCLIKYGFVQGPFHEADRLGFASVFSTDGMEVATDRAWAVYSPTLDFMTEAGRAGGAQPGWFRRLEGEALQFDSEVERILVASALFRRLQRHRKSDEALEHRLFQGMIKGSIDLLEACPELTWTDVDALWTTQLGFPRWRGGPLFQGALLGWEKMRAGMEASECGRTLGGPNDLLRQWEAGVGAPAGAGAEPRGQETVAHLRTRKLAVR